MNAEEARRAEVSRGAKPCRFEAVERPYVLLSRDRLNALRTAIEQPGKNRDVYLSYLLPNVERWVERAIEIPAPAGHYHHFTCTDGARFPPPPNQEIGTTGPYRCPQCGKEYSGERYDGARRNYEHTWLMRACRDLALAWALTDEARYARKAAEILVKYAEAYPGRHTTPTAGGIFYQSLDESMHTPNLAQAYDLLYDSGFLGNEDKRKIEYDLLWECAEGLSKMGAGGNWGSWHLSAVGLLGLATKHQRFIDYGIAQFERQIRDELGSDGLWPESVHTYHFFPLQAYLLFAEAATNAGHDLYSYQPHPKKGLLAMLREPLGYMYPSLQLPAINDGWFESFLPEEQYEVAWYRYRRPEFAYALARCREAGHEKSAGAAGKDPIWSLVLATHIPEPIGRPAFRSINFDNIGIAVLRNDDEPDTPHPMMMTFDYGRHLGHGQADKMGITLYANDRLLVADYGTPSYGSAILPYYTGTRSHNTVCIDGINQTFTKSHGFLTFRETPLVKIAAARTDEAYPGVEWQRSVVLADSYALVVDDLESTTDRVYDWLLRCEGDSLHSEGVEPSDEPFAFQYENITEPELFRPTKAVSGFRWDWDDGTGLLVSVLTDDDTRIVAARCPAESTARTIPMMVVRREGKSARFVSVLRPYRPLDDGRDAREVARPRIATDDDGEIVVEADGSLDRVRILRDRIEFARGQGDDRRFVRAPYVQRPQPAKGN